MKASLRHFRIFVATAETGQISKAALSLFTSQPVVTEAVKALEDEIGVKLFDRHARGVSLTSEGVVFLRHARRVLQSAEEAMQAPQQIRHDMTGVLKLACSYTVMSYFLPPLLARFQRKYPGIRVELIELTHKQIKQGIVDGSIELAICLTSTLELCDDIDTMVLTRSKRRLWLPVNHPLLAKKRIQLKDVCNEPYILTTADEADRTTMSYWEAAGMKPNVIFRTESIEAVRNLVAVGWGVSILSDTVYRSWTLENNRLEAVPLSDPVPSMDVGFAWNRDAQMGRCSRVFVDTCWASSGHAS